MADQLAVLYDSYLTERRSLCAVKEEGSASEYDKRSFVFQNFQVRPYCKIKTEKTLCLIQTRRQASVFFIVTRENGRGVLIKGVSFFKI